MRITNCMDYIQHFLKIRTKDGAVVPFRLNEPQRRLYAEIKRQWDAGKPVRIIILKARQMGFSTVTEAIIFFLTVSSMYAESMVVAHKDEATANLFRMSKRFYDLLPEEIKPMLRASNAQELVFDRPAKAPANVQGLSSRIRCATAGGSGVGRSYTLKCLHLSEYAFWPGDKLETFSGLVQAVPDKPGTMIIIESTANGYDEFKRQWDRAVESQRAGTDGFVPIFFPWHEMQEYRRTPLPGFRRTDEEERLAETYGLDDEQLAWRRWCIEVNCGGDLDQFRQEYPASPDEAFISTGRCAFDKQALVLWRQQVRQERWECGQFRLRYDRTERIASWKWDTQHGGPIRVRKHPEPGVPYVIGGDTAGTGSDYFAAHVIDNRTGEQVAVVHHQFGERAFAEQIYCLGRYYNDALVGLEVNYSTYPQELLEWLGYPRLYVRERLDTYTGKITPAYGFRTTAQSRALIVDGLRDVARYHLDTIRDYDTLGEMLVFVYDKNWKPQAENGEHDDLVMALAITHQIRSQQRTGVILPEGERRKWSASQWEDYRGASPEEQRLLRQKWGEPE